MRLIYFGSGEFGLPTLQRLTGRHQVVAVVTQPARPAGRHRQLTPTPIAAWARQHDLTVFEVEFVNRSEVVARLYDLCADAGVVIAFGQKLGEPVIEGVGGLAINLHASLLPRYRGAAPINHAIINGDQETGVSVISLSQRMDAGLVYGRIAVKIDPQETAGELHDRLAQLGPDLVERVLRDYEANTLQGEAQNEAQATRAPKLSKADGTVDFSASADVVRCRIHGLTPWPGVTATWHCMATGRSQPLFLRRVQAEPGHAHQAPPGTVLPGLRVAVGVGAVRLLEVQAAGGRTMLAKQFAQGHALAPGDRLDSAEGNERRA